MPEYNIIDRGLRGGGFNFLCRRRMIRPIVFRCESLFSIGEFMYASDCFIFLFCEKVTHSHNNL